MPQRTTSTFTTHGSSSPDDSTTSGAGASGGAAWSGYNGSSSEGFSEQQPLMGGGFGSGAGDGSGNPSNNDPLRSIGASAAVVHGTGELVTITMLPEKEGMFLFQHRNYEVKSIRRASTVIRRYSDFVWLLDCLHKRFPFRRVPLLPPKRVQREFCSRSVTHGDMLIHG